MIVRIFVSIGDDAHSSGEIECESFDPNVFAIVVGQVALAARDVYHALEEQGGVNE